MIRNSHGKYIPKQGLFNKTINRKAITQLTSKKITCHPIRALAKSSGKREHYLKFVNKHINIQRKRIGVYDSGIKGYSQEELSSYLEILNGLLRVPQEELEIICQMNDQLPSNNQYRLAAQVADGMTLGKIPRCPKCSHGRLVYNVDSGVYSCTGFAEGNKFIECQEKYQKDDIIRADWI